MTHTACTPAEAHLILFAKTTGAFYKDAQPIISAAENINATDDTGWSALHYAAQRGNVNLVQALVEAGADVNMLCGNRLPIEIAAHSTQDNMADKYHATFVVLLQLGSHQPFTHSTPKNSHPAALAPIIKSLTEIRIGQLGYRQQADIWFSGCWDAWESWTQKEGADLSKLTPRRLIQFTSINTIASVLSPARWEGHKQELAALVANPHIPPCHAARWLHTIAGLSDFLSQEPSTHSITQWQHTAPSPIKAARSAS